MLADLERKLNLNVEIRISRQVDDKFSAELWDIAPESVIVTATGETIVHALAMLEQQLQMAGYTLHGDTLKLTPVQYLEMTNAQTSGERRRESRTHRVRPDTDGAITVE